uniref:SDR family oxidoreductase n=1 Tax=Cellvibrio fontiphilus TaxID=1815559 RepID=UPI002B4C0930|nr:SDR family oxidoreductase [Cellvibrio fontiphilus]
MIVVTGASGQLGRLVVTDLLKKLPAREIALVARSPEKVADFAALGVQVRQGDYDQPDTLVSAFSGADKLLLISANEVGRRFAQHSAAIAAAKQAGVGQLVYTSLLHADSSPLPLCAEHVQTETLIRASGIPYVILRNGWYTENYLAGIDSALQLGAVFGSAGEGRIASAARGDYAEAAAAVLTQEHHTGRVYELAGDESYSLAEFAAEIALHSGKKIVYQNLPEADFKAALVSAGLPQWLATLLAESDVGASKGGLFDNSHQLSELIGRPTTSWKTQIKNLVDVQNLAH